MEEHTILIIMISMLIASVLALSFLHFLNSKEGPR